MPVKILIIDDDNSILVPTKTFLEVNGFECCTKNNFPEGEIAITSEDFDIVITDYKDNANNVDNAGESILNRLKSTKFTPLIIYTGFLGNIGQDIIDKQNSFFKIIEKDTGSEVILLESIKNTLQSKEYTIKKEIENEISISLKDSFKEYFWSIVHDFWNDFKDIDGKSLKNILLRKILKDLPPESLSSDTINPIEFYEHPIKNNEITTGSILQNGEDFFICINNDCDLVVRNSSCKISNINLLSIKDYTPYLTEDDQGNKRILNNNNEKYRESNFFLPKTFFFCGGYVEFNNIISKKIIIADGKIDLSSIGHVIARVHPPFINRFISNFSRHYNRFGTPEIDI